MRAGMVRVSVPAPAVAPNMEEVGGVKRIKGRRQRSAHWSDEPFMALSESEQRSRIVIFIS